MATHKKSELQTGMTVMILRDDFKDAVGDITRMNRHGHFTVRVESEGAEPQFAHQLTHADVELVNDNGIDA